MQQKTSRAEEAGREAATVWVHVEEGSSAVPTKGPDEHPVTQGNDDSAS